MSLKATSFVWENSKLSGGNLVMLLALADCHNAESGKCFGSLNFLAKKSRMSKRNAQRCLNDLQESGEIRLVMLGGHVEGRNLANEYEIIGLEGRDKLATPPQGGRDAGAIPVETPVPSQQEYNRNGDSPAALISVLNDSERLLKSWNELPKPFSKVSVLNFSRKASINRRLKEKFFAENWQAALAKFARSNFLKGGGTTGWIANFDWFLKPGSVEKIIEGYYDGKGHSRATLVTDDPRGEKAAMVERCKAASVKI